MFGPLMKGLRGRLKGGESGKDVWRRKAMKKFVAAREAKKRKRKERNDDADGRKKRDLELEEIAAECRMPPAVLSPLASDRESSISIHENDSDSTQDDKEPDDLNEDPDFKPHSSRRTIKARSIKLSRITVSNTVKTKPSKHPGKDYARMLLLKERCLVEFFGDQESTKDMSTNNETPDNKIHDKLTAAAHCDYICDKTPIESVRENVHNDKTLHEKTENHYSSSDKVDRSKIALAHEKKPFPAKAVDAMNEKTPDKALRKEITDGNVENVIKRSSIVDRMSKDFYTASNRIEKKRPVSLNCGQQQPAQWDLSKYRIPKIRSNCSLQSAGNSAKGECKLPRADKIGAMVVNKPMAPIIIEPLPLRINEKTDNRSELDRVMKNCQEMNQDAVSKKKRGRKKKTRMEDDTDMPRKRKWGRVGRPTNKWKEEMQRDLKEQIDKAESGKYRQSLIHRMAECCGRDSIGSAKSTDSSSNSSSTSSSSSSYDSDDSRSSSDGSFNDEEGSVLSQYSCRTDDTKHSKVIAKQVKQLPELTFPPLVLSESSSDEGSEINNNGRIKKPSADIDSIRFNSSMKKHYLQAKGRIINNNNNNTFETLLYRDDDLVSNWLDGIVGQAISQAGLIVPTDIDYRRDLPVLETVGEHHDHE